MMFISYAQNFEDVMLYRALKGVDKGFYVDVGANDPLVDSVTKAFYELGWSGINIEPEPETFRKLCDERTRDTNLQIAVSDQAGPGVLFDTDVRGQATFDSEVAERQKAQGHVVVPRNVEVRTLKDVCEQYVHGEIHFLKIDVEGWELQVLLGMDFSRFRPWIVLVEATEPGSQVESHTDWEPLLLDSNYRFVYFDGLNRYYVAAEHRDLERAFSSPPNVFDEVAKFREIQVATELAHTRQLLVDRETAFARMQEQNAAREAALTQIQRNLIAETEESVQLRQRLAAREASLAVIQQQLADAQEHLALAQQQLAENQQQLNAMYSSRSWRITAPLRLVGSAIKRRN